MLDLDLKKSINSPETMLAAVKNDGIIPFFKAGVPGWSIEEQTAPGYWFWEDEADTLGPWDWKVDVVQNGDIAYGKFLGGKAAFATVEFYRELMNWRRSLRKYRVALGPSEQSAEKIALNRKQTTGEKVMCVLSPIVLEAIKDNGAMGMKELRTICIDKVGKRIPGTQVEIKKNVMDSVMAFLQMGTWSVIGDIERVYRGPNLTYNGWQRTSNTTPDALFGISPRATLGRNDNSTDVISSGAEGEVEKSTRVPFWQSIIEPDEPEQSIKRTPEESREFLIQHVQALYPGAERKILEKII